MLNPFHSLFSIVHSLFVLLQLLSIFNNSLTLLFSFFLSLSLLFSPLFNSLFSNFFHSLFVLLQNRTQTTNLTSVRVVSSAPPLAFMHHQVVRHRQDHLSLVVVHHSNRNRSVPTSASFLYFFFNSKILFLKQYLF